MSDMLTDAARSNGPAGRAAINRENARRSTGPRTDSGKRRSSLNALRHGLTGHTVVLPTEDQAAYQRHAQAFLDECRPKGAIETQLVQSLIDASWRLNRVAAIETNLLSLGITENENCVHVNHPQAGAALAMALAFRENIQAFSSLSTHSQRIARQFERTLFELRRIQAERRDQEGTDLHRAAALLELHQEREDPPYDPACDGFVFSNDEIRTYIQRRDRLSRAQHAALHRYAAVA